MEAMTGFFNKPDSMIGRKSSFNKGGHKLA